MNIDLLKKLTKLANNNPNDNEANLAARRVCKMLEEADFKLIEPVKPEPKINQTTTAKSANTGPYRTPPNFYGSVYYGEDWFAEAIKKHQQEHPEWFKDFFK